VDKNILKTLKELEAEKGISLLYACETGSRAWGFPSPDSDYDIRFIYRHNRNWYLSLAAQKDAVSWMKGDLDITGWDLKKSLLLLKKSNVPLIERFQSPIIYYTAPGFKREFRQLIREYYSPITVFFHHYSLAQKFRAECRPGAPFKLKGFFYMLRSLLSCNWILHDDAVPPMELIKLLKYTNPRINKSILRLIALKATKPESYDHKGATPIFNWLEGLFEQLEASKGKPEINNNSIDTLNHYFIKKLDDPTYN